MPSSERPQVLEKTAEELAAVVARVRTGAADGADADTIAALVASHCLLTELIRDRQTTIARLRRLVFGAQSERREVVLGKAGPVDEPLAPGSGVASPDGEAHPGEPPRARPPGHGRHGPDDFPAAARVETAHGTLHAGDGCLHCKGRVYARPPQRLVRIVGLAPFAATVYEQERLRCNLCGEVYTAKAPAGVGEEKHDASAVAMVVLLRYGLGMPFYRVQALQESAGIPLPASTQWDLVAGAADALAPVHDALQALAARGEVLHNDDTSMTVLSVLKEGRDEEGRRGVFTTAVLSRVDGRTVALYATGRQHAGENLGDVLARRPEGLGPPIQMCDALERNLPDGLATIVSNCLVHMRRQFVDVAEAFPTEVRRVLDELAEVYRVEAAARDLSPQARLALHQAHSGPVMDRLALFLAELLDEKRAEPSSGLGKAIAYAQKRWDRLTLFLRVPGAPLDNNACEQVLKRAILHRKNSLFYKTQNGARAGDLFMSLIATARLAAADPFHYLTALVRHQHELATAPDDWLPWTYRETLARSKATGPGP